MKTLIVSINSKFIHSSLALWYLKASCTKECGEIKILDLTINDMLDSILAKIYSEKADVIAFSCYIWNISYVFKLAKNLKKVSPNIKVILGGPEVSFDANEIIIEKEYVDYVIQGEAEHVFNSLLIAINNEDYDLRINGVFKKDSDNFYETPYNIVNELDSIVSPYTDEMISMLDNKIVYFESSRGCPFSCSYCLSSTFDGVRYFSMERVKKDLMRLIEANVRQIKFVDRTFNCNKERAKEIFRFIIENAKDINFHFEVAADLFDDEMLEILSNAPVGLIQFEIGVQTTNATTLSLINRKTSLEKVFNNVKSVKALGNIHLHLDLIAGLPKEDYASFKRSFNDIYSLEPEQVQLGFLKMLKGSKIRRQAEFYSYEYREYAPYEVLSNKYISFDEVLVLKGIEEILDRYYNSGRFKETIYYCIKNLFETPFDFYFNLYLFIKGNGYLDCSLSVKGLYEVVFNFLKSSGGESNLIINELLKLDFLRSDNSNNLPACIEREYQKDFKEKCFEFLKNEEAKEKYLPNYVGVPAKQIFKKVHFEVFKYDVSDKKIEKSLNFQKIVLLFDYNNKDKVTGYYRYHRVDFDTI